MAIESVKAISPNKIVRQISQRFTKASLDAPIDSVYNGINATYARANYFPFDANISEINIIERKGFIPRVVDNPDFFRETELFSDINKITR